MLCRDILFMRRTVSASSFLTFMSCEICTLHLKMDNSAARQLALRHGVGNKTRHVAGRLLWLQQAAREKLLTVSAIASAYNLGDLSTKMHPANRLKRLLFLHGCADCDTAQSIGEFEEMVMKETIKAQVKRMRMEYAREHGCSPHISGNVNRLAKQIVMMTLLAMPQYSEAADDGGHSSPRMDSGFSTTWIAAFICFALLLYRALSWLRNQGVDFNSIVELTTADVGSSMLTAVPVGFSMIPEMSAEQWAIVMLCTSY